MATKEALEALQQTKKALAEIGTHLRPFVQRLRDGATTGSGRPVASSTSTATTNARHSLAQAQAAVALSLGTLRYMGARLRGLDQGRKADDPLRQELNQMRNVLRDIEKLGKQNEETQADIEKKEKKKPGMGSKKKVSSAAASKNTQDTKNQQQTRVEDPFLPKKKSKMESKKNESSAAASKTTQDSKKKRETSGVDPFLPKKRKSSDKSIQKKKQKR